MSRWSPPWSYRALGELVHEGYDGKTMLVWRVQNADGQGLYRSEEAAETATDEYLPEASGALYRFLRTGDQFQDLPAMSLQRGDGRALYVPARKGSISARRALFDIMRPTPERDFTPSEWTALPGKISRQYLFGFPTREAAMEWMGPKTLAWAKSHGYSLVQVPASRVILSRSGRQLIFVPAGVAYRAPPKNYVEKYNREMSSKVVKTRRKS